MGGLPHDQKFYWIEKQRELEIEKDGTSSEWLAEHCSR